MFNLVCSITESCPYVVCETFAVRLVRHVRLDRIDPSTCATSFNPNDLAQWYRLRGTSIEHCFRLSSGPLMAQVSSHGECRYRFTVKHIVLLLLCCECKKTDSIDSSEKQYYNTLWPSLLQTIAHTLPLNYAKLIESFRVYASDIG